MNEDAAFIEALQASPEDDALRLVYADWLEERGDERADYLRTVAALASMPEEDQRYPDLRSRLLGLCDRVDAEWRRLVGRQFDVILIWVDPIFKVHTAGALRFATGKGLPWAKETVALYPRPIRQGVLREEAERLKEDLEACFVVIGTGQEQIEERLPAGVKGCTVIIRPSAGPGRWVAEGS
ncbi:MAG: ribosomal protein L7/L12 [Gemmataceae bacterium]|nr:ribosomal protein L7/L12 [Gemmataceae bacterium]